MTTNNRVVNTPEGYFSRVDTSKPQIGIVKDNRDPEFMGRVKVWIRGSTSPEDDSRGWIWANYASPFGGATPNDLLGRNFRDFDSTQLSYGFWATPPDIDNQVIVTFINGDIRQAYWTGCIFHKDMNQMIPGIAEGSSYQSSDEEFEDIENPSIPVAEYNKLADSSGRRPFYEPLAESLLRQGLITDGLRGAGSSSARRESPSKVFGMLTPGGNQFVMDDGENSELIRLRTKSGAQILISETFGNVYIISKDGNNWFELNSDGNVDIYGLEDISIRSESSINIRADENINMEAGNSINMKALGEDGIKMEATIGNIDKKAVNYFCSVDESHNIVCKNLFHESKEKSHFKNGDYLVKSDTNINMEGDNQLRFASSDQISFTSGNVINFDGTRIDSNTGAGVLPDTAQTASPATARATNQKLDKDFSKEEGLTDVNLETILNRVPHHEPWEEHAVAVLGTREEVEPDSTSRASKGSVSERANSPLPLVGTPKKGMQEGVYTPQGYVGDEPLYSLSTSTNTGLRSVNELSISDAGIAFIARFEGFSANAYNDVGGKPTIGYGHLITGNEDFDTSKGITKQFALELLRKDARFAENGVRNATKVKLTQNQFDALVSFTFNLGVGAYRSSTLLKELNAGNYQEVPNQLSRWVFVNKERVRGLVRRRREEALLFSSSSQT